MLTVTVKQQKEIFKLIEKLRDKNQGSYTVEFHIWESFERRFSYHRFWVNDLSSHSKEGQFVDSVEGVIEVLERWLNE